MPLHLKLRRGEKLLVNGAVLEIGPRYGEVVVHNQSHCLRGSDLLREDETTTPSRRVYFQVQMMIVEPAALERWRLGFEALMTPLEGALVKPEILARLAQVRLEVAEGRPYRALALLRHVRKYEDMLLAAARLDEATARERHAHAGLAPGAIAGPHAAPGTASGAVPSAGGSAAPSSHGSGDPSAERRGFPSRSDPWAR